MTDELRKPGVFGPITLAVIAGVFGIFQYSAGKADPAPIDCPQQYLTITKVLSATPDANVSMSADSPAEEQCHINDFIKSIKGKKINPPPLGQ